MVEPGRGAASRQQEHPEVDAGIDELFGVADLEQAAANHESAIRTYRRVLDREVTSEQKARALMGVGTCLERIGRWKEALNVLEDAAQAARESESDFQLGQILVELGLIHLGRGEIERALTCGREALEKAEQIEDVSAEKQAFARGLALNFLGHAMNRRGDQDESASYFTQALSAFKTAGDIRRLGYAYNNLGLIFKQKCEWNRALEYLQVASSLQAIEGEYPERRAGMHNLGLVHFRMGNWDRARECFEGSLTISRDVNDPLGIIRGLLATAGVDLVQRRWDAALDALEQSLELCSEELYPRETALTYRSLGQLHQARGDLSRSRRCLEVAWRKAVEISEDGDLARELLRLRSELALEEGQLADASNLAERAVEISSRTEDRMEIALATMTLSRVQFAQGDERSFESILAAQEMLRRLESPLPLVEALLEEGRMRLSASHDLVRAETVYHEAMQLLGTLDLPEMTVESLIGLARVVSAREELNRAGEYLEDARRQAAEIDDAETQRRLAEAQKELEERLVQTSVSTLGAFRTAGRLEEIVESRRPYVEKLNAVLEIIAQGVEADGAALVFAQDDTPGATYRIGSTASQKLSRTVRRIAPERPEIVLDATTGGREAWNDVTGLRKVGSLMLIPIYGNGMAAHLYLDRLVEGRRSAFGPSHLNLCLALAPQLEALVDRVSLEAVDRTDEDTLQRRTFLADVVTQNPDMIEILKLVEKINRTELTVLLQGETGTGKTLIARAIHLSSHRAEGPFVTVDCAALPENLLESELFGYVKGAFTGAGHDKKGLFEEADGGTIFLDEIGRAGLGVQRRLLHLLDKGEVRPVGSTTYRKLNVRVICATSSRDLLVDTDRGPFIKDLYYRLNDIIIRVPSLRDRPEDIPLLAEYFLETFNGQTGRETQGFNRGAMQRLVRYQWPGNVRELEKVVRRAAILSEDGESIGVDLLPQEVLSATDLGPAVAPTGDSDLRATVEDMERRMVLDALEKHGWNKTRAAKELGLSRKGLKNKITRYGLDPELS